MASTEIGAQLTELYARQQAAVAAQVTAVVLDLVPALDVSSIAAMERSWPAIERALMATIDNAYVSSSGLALNYYELFRAVEGAAGFPTPILAGALPAAQVATSLKVMGPYTAKALISEGDRDIIAKLLMSLVGSGSRLALAGGRNTLLQSGEADRQLLGFSRQCHSKRPCAFCRMLRSRGPVYRSERSATFAKSGERYHDHCRCQAEPVYGEEAAWVPGAREDRDLWDLSTVGLSGNDALKAFRAALGTGH
jgi:hypothetical protein